MVTLFSLDDAALSRRLERLASLAWLPGALLEIVGGTLRLQRAARSSLNPPDAARLAVAGPEARAQGAPWLPAADFPYDPAPASPLWDELCTLLASLRGSPAEAVQTLRRETAADEMLPAKAFAAFMQNDEAFFSAWAARLPQAPALIHFLAQATLTPQLAAVTDALATGASGNTGIARTAAVRPSWANCTARKACAGIPVHSAARATERPGCNAPSAWSVERTSYACLPPTACRSLKCMFARPVTTT